MEKYYKNDHLGGKHVTNVEKLIFPVSEYT